MISFWLAAGEGDAQQVPARRVVVIHEVPLQRQQAPANALRGEGDLVDPANRGVVGEELGRSGEGGREELAGRAERGGLEGDRLGLHGLVSWWYAPDRVRERWLQGSERGDENQGEKLWKTSSVLAHSNGYTPASRHAATSTSSRKPCRVEQPPLQIPWLGRRLYRPWRSACAAAKLWVAISVVSTNSTWSLLTTPASPQRHGRARSPTTVQATPPPISWRTTRSHRRSWPPRPARGRPTADAPAG